MILISVLCTVVFMDRMFLSYYVKLIVNVRPPNSMIFCNWFSVP